MDARKINDRRLIADIATSLRLSYHLSLGIPISKEDDGNQSHRTQGENFNYRVSWYDMIDKTNDWSGN